MPAVKTPDAPSINVISNLHSLASSKQRRGQPENLAPKKSKGTELDVFSGRAGRANAAIIDVLAKETPQTIKQLLKKITKYEGLEETYYASLTKRLHNLTESGLIEEIKSTQKGAPASYGLCVKAYLAMFLKENSMQDIFDKATDTQAATILLALMNVFSSEKTQIIKKAT